MRCNFILAVPFFAVGFLPAADQPPPPAPKDPPAGDKEKAKDLFDGKTLKGWKVIGCEAVVQDGAILIKAGDGVVRTEKPYKDYILEVEWKALKPDKWDSGIYIRCTDPPKGKPWPENYQVNLQKGQEGNLLGVKGATSTGLIKAGEWNHFKLTVEGSAAKLEINDKPAWKGDGLKTPEGFISLQAEVPGGGQFLFRNLRLLELHKKA